jgi:hypothetical protein
MKFFMAMAVAPILSLTLSTQLEAQIALITEAPFTASILNTDDGEKAYVGAYLARASNGSTYQARMDSDGRALTIEIQDVPNNRYIALHPLPPSYTYSITPPRGGKFITQSIDQYREFLQAVQNKEAREVATKPEWVDMYGAHHHPVVLGAINQDGMTLFGRLDDLTYANGKTVAEEHWRSDLGLFVSDKINADSPTEGKSSRISKVTDLHLGEPDPKLFEIPAEYFSGNDPLLNAKSVFIDNETGEQEVEDRAIAWFNEWKRMAVKATKQEADIVAVFSKATTDDLGPAVSSIEMNIYQSVSEHPIFAIRPHLPSDIVGLETTRQDKWAAGRCVDDLRGRITNTRIGLITPSRSIQ